MTRNPRRSCGVRRCSGFDGRASCHPTDFTTTDSVHSLACLVLDYVLPMLAKVAVRLTEGFEPDAGHFPVDSLTSFHTAGLTLRNFRDALVAGTTRHLSGAKIRDNAAAHQNEEFGWLAAEVSEGPPVRLRGSRSSVRGSHPGPRLGDAGPWHRKGIFAAGGGIEAPCSGSGVQQGAVKKAKLGGGLSGGDRAGGLGRGAGHVGALALPPVSLLAVHENRSLGVREHLDRLATEDYGRYATPPVRGHHD
jgi:hypothetical protein